MGMGRGTVGTVTEATADHYTIKTELGDTLHRSLQREYADHEAAARQPRRGQGQGDGGERTPPQPIKASDIKVGDVIAASGESRRKRKIGWRCLRYAD